jgi:hypothetical protein
MAPRLAFLLVVAAFAVPAGAQEDAEATVRLGGILETRFARTGSTASWTEGGLGKARYGGLEDHSSNLLSLSHAALLVDASPGELVSLHVQANLDAETDDASRRGTVGLVEAFGTVRHDTLTWLRLRAKAGLFFPPISLEHHGAGWTTTHTLTPSALNAWIGEEVRAVGAEARAVFVVRDHEITLLGSAFGGNDPAGTLLHWRGWALHDRQTASGDELALPPISAIGRGGLFGRQAPWTAPIRELDGRLGWYAGASWRQNGRFELSALRWDNRADPAAFDGFQYGWYTEFDVYGGRLSLPLGLEVLAQRLTGETEMGVARDGTIMAHSEWDASYVMLSGRWGRLRLSARYDTFGAEDLDPFQAEDDNDEDGTAWTAAAIVRVGGEHEVLAEWLRVDSERDFRADLGLPVHAREDLLQLALRVRF